MRRFLVIGVLLALLPVLTATATSAAQHCTIKGTGGDDRIVGTRHDDRSAASRGTTRSSRAPGETTSTAA